MPSDLQIEIALDRLHARQFSTKVHTQSARRKLDTVDRLTSKFVAVSDRVEIARLRNWIQTMRWELVEAEKHIEHARSSIAATWCLIESEK